MKSTTFKIAAKEIAAFKAVCRLKKQGHAESIEQVVRWFLEASTESQKYIRKIRNSTRLIVISSAKMEDTQWEQLKLYCDETYIKIGVLLPKIIKQGVISYYESIDTAEAEILKEIEDDANITTEISTTDMKEYMLDAIIQEQDFLSRYKKIEKETYKNKEKTPFENNIGAYTTDYHMEDLRLKQKTEIKTIFEMAAWTKESPEKILLNGIGINENATIENLLNSPYLMDLIAILIDDKDLEDNCTTMDDYCERVGINVNEMTICGMPVKGLTIDEIKKLKKKPEPFNPNSLFVGQQFKFDDSLFIIDQIQTEGDNTYVHYYVEGFNNGCTIELRDITDLLVWTNSEKECLVWIKPGEKN